MAEKNKHINQIWKCLPIYEKYGHESYEIYLSKIIGHMRSEELTDIESAVLEDLVALYNIGDMLKKPTLRSVILSCTNRLDEE